MARSLSMLCVGAAVFLAGCVQMAPVPGYARAGDALVLGLGGIKRNVGGNQVLTASDLTITLTDSANTTYNLSPTYLFKAFPDYAGQINYQMIGGTSTIAPLNVQPFDGGWFVTVRLPTSTPPVATGPATISITSPTGKLVNNPSDGNAATFPNMVHEGDMTSIPLEILPGSTNPGSTASTNYMNQFRGYSTALVPGFNIAPSTLLGLPDVGGMQVTLTYTNSAYKPIVLPYNHNPSINLQQNTVDNGNGTYTLNVILTAPQGFSATETPRKPSLRDLNLRVMFFGTSGTYSAPDFQVVSSKLIDTSGNVIPGVSATRSALAL
jgi:hypothetical protein